MSRPSGPTFFVLGAAKSGTTALCDAVARHPDVLFSAPKEPVFFEREYERGLDYYWQEYFSHWSGERAIGEGRVYNLYLAFVPERIRAAYPDARLLAILRNPVDRAYSHWWHRVARGYERRSFEEAVEDELRELEDGREFGPARDPEAWQGNFFPGTRGVHADVREVRYLEMGHYAEQLDRYRAAFDPSRIHVLRFEDFVRDPKLRLREVWRFLGVDPNAAEPRLRSKNTASESVKSRPAFLLERLAWRLGLDRLVPKGWRTKIRRVLSRSRPDRPPMSSSTRATLERHFRPHNHALGTLVDWESDRWSEGG